MFISYYTLIEKCIRDNMNDTDIIKAVFAKYGIRSYKEIDGHFCNVTKGIMKHLRADIKEIRGNVKFLQSVGL